MVFNVQPKAQYLFPALEQGDIDERPQFLPQVAFAARCRPAALKGLVTQRQNRVKQEGWKSQYVAMKLPIPA